MNKDAKVKDSIRSTCLPSLLPIAGSFGKENDITQENDQDNAERQEHTFVHAADDAIVEVKTTTGKIPSMEIFNHQTTCSLKTTER